MLICRTLSIIALIACVAQYTSILVTLLMVLMSLTLMVSELLLLPQLNEYVPKDDRNAGYGGSILCVF
jgi:hypothetical protein